MADTTPATVGTALVGCGRNPNSKPIVLVAEAQNSKGRAARVDNGNRLTK